MNAANPKHPKNTITPTITPTQTNMSPDALTWWSDWSDRLSIAAVIIGSVLALISAVGWGFSRKSGKLKEAALEGYKIEAGVKISEANAKAADANKAAALANERAAKLEMEAAEARLKYAELESTITWRDLSKDQIARLESILSKKPSRLKLVMVANDPEVIFFSVGISKAFTGWCIHPSNRTYKDALVIGLTIVGSSSEEVDFVRSAFQQVGIPFSTNPIRHEAVDYGLYDHDGKRPGVEIIVGCKPRPQLYK
jgi:hypothetical protein